MNRIHKTRFNRRLGVWQAVPETARGGGKSKAGALATTVLLGAALSSTFPAQAQQWIGGTGDWFAGGNWDTGAPPDGSIDATIRNGGTAQVQAGSAVAVGIVVRRNSALEVSGPGQLTSFYVYVGDPLGGGTVRITGGGRLLSTSSSAWDIDYGSALLVDGAGSLGQTANGGNVNIGSRGAATATVSNGGVLSTIGSVFLGGTSTGAGTLNIGDGAGAGIADAARVVGGPGAATVNFNHTDANYFFTRDGASTGVGVPINGKIRVEVNGGGTTTLVANNEYWDGTTITSGTLRIGNGGTTGTLGTGAITNNAFLVFDRSDTYTVGNAISGSGRLTQAGAGTLVLANVNSYSGGTQIDDGVLQIGNPGALGTGTVSLNGGQLSTTATMDLGNAITFEASKTSGITAADGTSLRLLGEVNIGAGAEARFGTSGGTGSIDLAGSITLSTSAHLHVMGGTLTRSGAGGLGFITGNVRDTTVEAGAVLDYGTSDGSIRALFGTGTVRVGTPGRTLEVSQGVFGGTIEGGGQLEKDHGAPSDTLILTGTNTYTGGTRVSSGTLQVGDGLGTGTLGSGAIVLETGSTLAFNRTGTLVVDDDISTTNTGHLRQMGGGTVVLAGTNSYTDTFIDGGTLQVGNGGATGTLGTGTVTNNGSLVFDRSGTYTVANVISGSGSVTKMGTGTIVLTDVNTYSGGTAINGGTLSIAANSGLGAPNTALSFDGGTLRATGNVDLAFRPITLHAGGGTFDTDGVNIRIDGGLAGAGGLTKTGSGTLTLTGANTYGGGTTISSGTVQVGDGGTAGTLGSGNVVNSGALAFNRSDTVSLANIISGSGSLTQEGSGKLVLTGANTYTGGTFVNAGTLSVNGTIVGDTTVNSGGALGGTGTVGNVAIASGGTLAPGNSIGTLTVNGNLSFAPGSIYRVEANSAGEADRVNTVGAGTITINGGTVDVQAGGAGYQRNTRYTILRSGGSTTGRFDNATTNLAFLTPTLIYEADGVLLNLEASGIAGYASAARTPNQTAVANYLQSFANTPSNEQAAGLIQQLDNLTADQAAAAFESMPGSAHASASQVASALGRNFSATLAARSGFSTGGLGNAMNDWSRTHYASLAPIEMPSASGDERGMWVQALGAGGNLDTDGNAAGSRYRSNGIVLGYDQPVTRQWLLGGAFGYSTSWWNSTSGDSASGRIESPQAGLYARYAGDSVRVRIDGTFARHDFTTNRTVRVGATSANTNATHKGNEWGLAGQVEMPIQAGNWELRPLAGVRYAQLNEDGFSETGQGPANLSVAERTSQNTLFSAGMHFVRMFNQGKGGVELRAVASHLAGDNDSPVTASIAGQAGSFTATGVPLKRNALTLGTTVSGQFTRDVSAYLDANYEVRGSGQDAYRLTAGVRVAF